MMKSMMNGQFHGTLSQTTRRLAACSLGLVTLLATATSIGANPRPAAPRLALHWIDGFDFCGPVRDIAMKEAAAILGRTGVEVTWREPKDAAYPSPHELSVKVILVETHPSQWHLQANALGAVMGTGVPRGSAYVFATNALAALGIENKTRSCLTPRRNFVLGRALARILVHEIVHAVVPEHPHSASGVMTASFDHDALIVSGLAVDGACARAFRLAVGYHTPVHPGDP